VCPFFHLTVEPGLYLPGRAAAGTDCDSIRFVHPPVPSPRGHDVSSVRRPLPVFSRVKDRSCFLQVNKES